MLWGLFIQTIHMFSGICCTKGGLLFGRGEKQHCPLRLLEVERGTWVLSLRAPPSPSASCMSPTGQGRQKRGRVQACLVRQALGGGQPWHLFPPAVCKSCIVKFLQTSKYCPLCSTKIHETQPLLNLKLDRVMQDVVYKLVPGLQESKHGEGACGALGPPAVGGASWGTW